MALIEIYHVVADMYPVDADWDGTNFLEGQMVSLSALGEAQPATNATFVIGVAGDTQSNTTSATPFGSQVNADGSTGLIINGAGATRQTSNRVSDFFNETLASGRMTVYNSGGKFATDLFEADVDAAVPGDLLYSSANGLLTTVAGLNIAAVCVAAVQAWDSGVPGVDTANGSMSLGDYVTFKLLV